MITGLKSRIMTLINLLKWEHSCNKNYPSENLIRGVFTNFDILEEPLGIVPMQRTTIV